MLYSNVCLQKGRGSEIIFVHLSLLPSIHWKRNKNGYNQGNSYLRGLSEQGIKTKKGLHQTTSNDINNNIHNTIYGEIH